MATLVVVSDTHLSERAPLARDQWDVALAAIESLDPALVVHAGDISLDGPRHPGDLDYARAQLDRIPAPWRAVPGNHDLGDIGETATPATIDGRRAYQQRFGDGCWTVELGPWRVVGVDSQALFGDESDREQTWAWLDDALAGAGRPEAGSDDGGLCLVLHRPVLPVDEGEVDAPHRYVPEPGRSRLLDTLERHGVDVVINGHVHQQRTFEHRGVRHVWAPSVWATVGDDRQPVIGEKRTGIAVVELGSTVDVRFEQPDGLAAAVIGETFPSPYGG